MIVEDQRRPNTIKLQSFYGNIYRVGFFMGNPSGYLLTCDIATFNHGSKLVNVGVFWKLDPLIGGSGSSFFRAVAICLPLDGSSTDEYEIRGVLRCIDFFTKKFDQLVQGMHVRTDSLNSCHYLFNPKQRIPSWARANVANFHQLLSNFR
ncbi:hypothetical protein M5689_006761 [Euphorbia peplus]|nr:hypothetical protein M5689_006761 [Euphorbia peplus]